MFTGLSCRRRDRSGRATGVTENTPINLEAGGDRGDREDGEDGEDGEIV
jgi:hypothetical protein